MNYILRKTYISAFIILATIVTVLSFVNNTAKAQSDRETIKGRIESIEQGEEGTTAKLSLDNGETITANISVQPGIDKITYKVGDRVYVGVFNSGDRSIYQIEQPIRTNSLLLLLVIFVIIAILIARRTAISSLLGLAASFFVIFGFMIPALLKGYEVIFISIITAGLIGAITFYLSHGFNRKTTIAIISTAIALLCTALIGNYFISSSNLTGLASEELLFLLNFGDIDIDIRKMILAGIIIGTLGVLDDITISQASIVSELKRANPNLSDHEIFKRSMNVGRDHIASLINTLVLVYTGGSLPLLLLFTAQSGLEFSYALNLEIVAEEIIRTLSGTIGLILAVPITSYIATKHIKVND